MDAIEMLTQRRSSAKLGGSAPTQNQLEIILQAASRAADHGNLQPWRFIAIADQGLLRLGEVFEAALVHRAGADRVSLEQRERACKMPQRAPFILVVVARVVEHPKVPALEQLLAVGAAAQNIINAAFALNVGAIWRTGEFAVDPQVKAALAVEEQEQIIGFIYMGEPTAIASELKPSDTQSIISTWPSN